MNEKRNAADAAAPMPLTMQIADAVHCLDRVDSTNAYARRLLADGGSFHAMADRAALRDELPMMVVSADDQTSGHGRLGRSWTGAPGQSLMVSFATVLPRGLVADPARNGWLQMMAGVAALDALNDAVRGARPIGVDAALMLKWPNDVFCAGAKLGGILCELVPFDERRCGLIIGVGVNLRIPAERLPTPQSTSLQLHWDGLPDTPALRDAIAAVVVRRVRALFQAFVEDPSAEARRVHRRVIENSYTLGRRVTVRMSDGRGLTGTAVSINDDASLTVRGDDGRLTVVTTGDVGVMPM